LVASGGASHSDVAVSLAGELAQESDSAVTVVTVIRNESGRARAQEVQAEAARILAGRSSDLTSRVRVGDPAEEIVAEVLDGSYDLLILGERPAHGILSRVRGTIRERVIGHVSTPVIVAKGRARQVRRILLCDSGAQASSLSDFTGRFADVLREDIEITVLHVMSQMPAGISGPYDRNQLEADAAQLIEGQSFEGEFLERDIQVLGRSRARAVAKVRHGLVIDEILEEAVTGNYDLVVIGAHRGEGWQRYLLTDVAREIILRSTRPVLIVQ
jgi:nucleotide-binding universal stress UspA family protein